MGGILAPENGRTGPFGGGGFGLRKRGARLGRKGHAQAARLSPAGTRSVGAGAMRALCTSGAMHSGARPVAGGSPGCAHRFFKLESRLQAEVRPQPATD